MPTVTSEQINTVQRVLHGLNASSPNFNRPMPSVGEAQMSGGFNKSAISDLHADRKKTLKGMTAIIEASRGREMTQDEDTAYQALNELADRINEKLDSVQGAAYEVYDKSGRRFQALSRDQKMSAGSYVSAGENFSLGDYVRANMGLQTSAGPMSMNAIARGAATVPEHLASIIIDDVREQARIVQAGARTIPIVGKTTVTKITGDPTVYQHTEGATDISESNPTFAPVVFDPKMIAALIPLTVELVQDATNLDAALNTVLSAAFAQKLDDLCLATLLADSSIEEGGYETDTWQGVLQSVGAMLGLDMEIPSAWIANSADYIARASQVASDSGAWLGRPPVLANMLDLQTSKIESGYAMAGDFSRGFAIAARTEMTVEVVRWNQPTKATHLLVAHARLDGYVLQPKALYRVSGETS